MQDNVKLKFKQVFAADLPGDCMRLYGLDMQGQLWFLSTDVWLQHSMEGQISENGVTFE